jgi:hypothetical protein
VSSHASVPIGGTSCAIGVVTPTHDARLRITRLRGLWFEARVLEYRATNGVNWYRRSRPFYFGYVWDLNLTRHFHLTRLSQQVLSVRNRAGEIIPSDLIACSFPATHHTSSSSSGSERCPDVRSSPRQPCGRVLVLIITSRKTALQISSLQTRNSSNAVSKRQSLSGPI